MSTEPPAKDVSRPRTVRELAASRRSFKQRPQGGGPALVWPGKQSNGAPSPSRLALVSGESRDGMLISGDNAHALSAMLESKLSANGEAIKLAYLDPPFNTGSQFGHYDDAASVADWLSALRDRLVAVRGLLHSHGSVWLHLDDRQQHHGRCLMDEVYGSDAFVATVIWQRRASRDNRKAFSASHDYLHVYAPIGQRVWKSVRNGFANEGAFINPDDDPRGPWRSVPLSAQAGHGTATQFYTITTPAGTQVDPPPGRCWTYTAARFQELVVAGRVYWPKNGAGRPRVKRYADEVLDLAPSTVWLASDVGDTAVAKKEVIRAVGGSVPFDTPKPESLMERIIHIATDPGDWVLDPYLGSGTTAVVASKMSRRWIGIEALDSSVSSVTVPRLRHSGAGESFTLLRAEPGDRQAAS